MIGLLPVPSSSLAAAAPKGAATARPARSTAAPVVPVVVQSPEQAFAELLSKARDPLPRRIYYPGLDPKQPLGICFPSTQEVAGLNAVELVFAFMPEARVLAPDFITRPDQVDGFASALFDVIAPQAERKREITDYWHPKPTLVYPIQLDSLKLFAEDRARFLKDHPSNLSRQAAAAEFTTALRAARARYASIVAGLTTPVYKVTTRSFVLEESDYSIPASRFNAMHWGRANQRSESMEPAWRLFDAAYGVPVRGEPDFVFGSHNRRRPQGNWIDNPNFQTFAIPASVALADSLVSQTKGDSPAEITYLLSLTGKFIRGGVGLTASIHVHGFEVLFADGREMTVVSGISGPLSRTTSIPHWKREVRLPSGVRYTNLLEGDGALASRGMLASTSMQGWYGDSTEFFGPRLTYSVSNTLKIDANGNATVLVENPGPYSWIIGSGEPTKGWSEGVEGMRVKGRRRVHVPAALAYGATGEGVVPPNSDLEYDVILVDVQPAHPELKVDAAVRACAPILRSLAERWDIEDLRPELFERADIFFRKAAPTFKSDGLSPYEPSTNPLLPDDKAYVLRFRGMVLTTPPGFRRDLSGWVRFDYVTRAGPEGVHSGWESNRMSFWIPPFPAGTPPTILLPDTDYMAVPVEP